MNQMNHQGAHRTPAHLQPRQQLPVLRSSTRRRTANLARLGWCCMFLLPDVSSCDRNFFHRPSAFRTFRVRWNHVKIELFRFYRQHIVIWKWCALRNSKKSVVNNGIKRCFFIPTNFSSHLTCLLFPGHRPPASWDVPVAGPPSELPKWWSASCAANIKLPP